MMKNKNLSDAMEPKELDSAEAAEETMEPKKFEDHEIQGAADTIMKAHEHMADANLMKHVHPLLDKKVKAIKSIAELRKKAKMIREIGN